MIRCTQSTKILILGAGIYQVPLIRRARQLGFRVVVASWRGDDPGMALAHESWVVDTTDKQKLLELARRSNVDAVTTTGTDVAVPSIGYICDRLGLPGVGYEAALNSANKIRMQERFAAAHVPTAAGQRARTSAQAREVIDRTGLPAVVKAPDSSGARGVTVVEAPAQVAGAFERAMEVSRSGEVLVQQYLAGEEFGAQVILADGEVVCCLCHNDTLMPGPIAGPIGHSCPSRLPGSVKREAAAVCGAALRALGVRDAVCNADLIATSEGVRLFEIGARIGATGIAEIIHLHCGLNLYDVALQMALGRRPDVRVAPQGAAATLIIRSAASGRLVRCRAPRRARRDKEVIAVNFDYAEGASVRQFRNGPDRIGDVLVVAETAAAAERRAEQVVGMLEIEVRPSR